jgi:cation diffusion facilitator family transporter
MMIPHYAVSPRRDAERSRQGLMAAGFGIVANLVLIALKGTIGVLGHSQALIADAVHSGADLLNSCIAAASFLYSRRPADWNHPYGHERAEAFASTIAAVLIAVAGVGVGYDSLRALLAGHPETPSLLTLVAAGIAIAVKLGMSTYVGNLARRIRSKSLLAEARDHLLDVVSSVLVIVGIALARLGLPWFDALAGLGVAAFILATSAGILRDAASELLDTSLSPEQRQQIIGLVETVTGVVRVRGIAGRTIGHTILVELHVDLDPKLSVGDAAHIVDAIKESVLAGMEDVRTVVVEINTDQFEPEALHLMAPPGRAG